MIEDHIVKKLGAEEELLFQAKLILYPTLKDKVKWQEKVYALVQTYGRKKLKEEIGEVHQKLFSAPEHEGFRKKILNLFTKF